jgi:hypothetical protein
MSTRIELEYCGVHGSGATVKEAKLDATRTIENYVDRQFCKRVVQWRGNAVVIIPSLQGWDWIQIHNDEPEKAVVHSPGGYCDSGADLAATLERAKEHVARLGWKAGEGIPELLTTPESRRSFASWAGFQLAYNDARTHGLPDVQRHQWALDHSREFEIAVQPMAVAA